MLAIVRLGNRFGSRWQVIAWLGVGLSVTWILLVFAAIALMLFEYAETAVSRGMSPLPGRR